MGDPTPAGNSAFDWNNPQNSWEGLGEGASNGGEAFIDGIVPFADPFADNDYYDKCESGLAFSKGVGEFVRDTELSLLGTGIIARSKAFFNSKYLGYGSKLFRRGGQWNKGNFRIGWGWKKTANFNDPVFRIAVGKRTKISLIERLRHLDFHF